MVPDLAHEGVESSLLAAQQEELHLAPSTRYDGGPEEGTRGASSNASSNAVPGPRYDGGPEEGSRGSGH